jgi:hypothetical protein
MYRTISNAIIRKFHPCYDPSDVIKDENEELPIKDWVQKYRDVVPTKDIIWLLFRMEFLSEKDFRLFTVWCAREALKSVENQDERSINACNVAERYANGEATKEELFSAREAAHDAIYDAGHDAHPSVLAAYSAAYTYSANYYVSYTVYYTSYAAQLDKLLTYFE